MPLKGISCHRPTLALLTAALVLPLSAGAQSGHAGHGQHDHGTKPAAAPAKPTTATPADKSPAKPVHTNDNDHVVGAADASMSGDHEHGDMNMRFHMEMTPTRPATREDSIKADRVLAELRESISKYRDTAAAVADGYKMFMPKVKVQRIYHFTNGRRAFAEAFRFNAAKPTSLL